MFIYCNLSYLISIRNNNTSDASCYIVNVHVSACIYYDGWRSNYLALSALRLFPIFTVCAPLLGTDDNMGEEIEIKLNLRLRSSDKTKCDQNQGRIEHNTSTAVN